MSRELDFERPVLELERQIEALRRLAAGRDNLPGVVATGLDRDDGGRGAESGRRRPPPGGGRGKRPPARGAESRRRVAGKAEGLARSSARTPEGALLHRQIAALELRARRLKEQIFSGLSRWQIVQVARHPERPYALDYIRHAFTDFVELHGERRFADDSSIVGGLARLKGEAVMVVGHQKGRTTNENLSRNFGMPRPEGYHKALRLMRLADRFRRPIVTLIDTPGAYPGIDAEERGQARAIAEALEGMSALQVPVVSVIIGEGGSGGALAIGVGNRVLMLEYAIYSVISPEGCASILFKDASFAERAANALKLSAGDLVELGVVDEVIKEGLGGAHRDPMQTAERVGDAVHKHLRDLVKLSPDAIREDRYRRFRFLGSLAGGRIGGSDGGDRGSGAGRGHRRLNAPPRGQSRRRRPSGGGSPDAARFQSGRGESRER